PSALAATWPASTDWVPVQYASADLTDVCNDVSGNDWWDIGGDSSNPAAYYYDDGTNLWFRLRLHDSPYSTSHGSPADWRNFGWAVVFETDFGSSDASYDYRLFVDGNAEEVILATNSTQTSPIASDSAETT